MDEDCLAYRIKGELLTIYGQIQSLDQSPSADNLKQKLTLLDSIAHQQVPPRVIQMLRIDPELQPCLRNILQIHREAGVQVELRICREILDSSDPWEAFEGFHYLRNYQYLVKREGSAADLRSGDQVTFLGSGPFPVTLILLHRFFRIRGIGIEIDPERADLSRKVLARLSLDKDIHIFTGSEDSLIQAKESKLVMIAAFAEPRERIFQRLAEVAGPETLVSYRIYEKGMRSLFSAQPPDITECGQFREIQRIPPEGPVNNTIVFLEKSCNY